MDYLNFDLSKLSKDELVELLQYHNRRYWEVGSPEISDFRYDEIVEALRAVAPENALLQQIHTPAVVSNGKVHHNVPMLSLDKAYTLQALLDWANKYARTPDELLLVEPKYDGISALYEDGVLSTRGDGVTGEDVSDKLPLIELEAPGWKGKLNRPARGEIVIRDDDFQNLYSHIRRKDGGFYKNPRNAVAGIMGLKEIDMMLMQGAKLTLVDYTLISIPVKLSELAARWETLEAQLNELPYPRDGVVLKLADTAYRESLGNTAHHPRGEIAYKFSNIKRETKLLDVEWSFGKNNLTPVAILEPVEISGTTIKRATLHNVQNIIDMDLQIGDTVTVERAGDVIPYITARTPGADRRSPLIFRCPACQSTLERRGPELVCPNPACPGTNLQKLGAAVRALEIDNLGDSTLKKLIENCNVRHLGDLFKLKTVDLLQLEGFAAKSAANLYNELQRARNLFDWQLLTALNVPNVGSSIAKLLLSNHTFAELRTASIDTLSAIEGIGPERAKALTQVFEEKKEFIDELLEAVTLRREVQTSDRPTICFTGKMPEKRSYYEKLAEQRGFQPVSAVTKTLALLVAFDINEHSSKLENARKFGVKIESLDEFLAEGANSAPASPESDELF